MDIGAWLRELGLGQYEQAFRDHDVDADLLAKLTAEDLKEIGVASVGHRRRLLAAAAGPPGPALAAAEAISPERRQLTVLFVDLVGSTALSARLDPEELRHVLRSYQDAVARGVAAYDGHVAKYMGDGVLAYLGWPRAHEDDAERAVRAALTAVSDIGGLRVPGGEPLAARAGIATGLVVVGDLVGEGTAREESVVGETPNLAARLQTLAASGEVVIAPSTRRLLGELFRLEQLPPATLKGLAAPVTAWRVLGEHRIESRLEARGGVLAPLVGRGQELALLLGRWRQARSGEGQVVLLVGEPGIGKSRLIQALREATRKDGRAALRYQSSPHHRSSPLWPVARQIERLAGLEHDDPPDGRWRKLEAVLARATADPRQAALLLAPLLGVAEPEGQQPLDLAPQQRKALTLQLLAELLEDLTRRQPVLMLVEDLHWTDPTTRELLDLVVDRLQRWPVLLVATFRPELAPPWTDFPHVALLALNRLARAEAAALLDAVAGGRALPAIVTEAILERTGGIPLFVEELTRTVLESGLLQEMDDGLLPPLAIPSTLQDSLMARLDRLGPAKRMAQIGSAIGREFSLKLLAEVADVDEETLAAGLAQLVGSGLAFQRGSPPDAVYTFKHALVQDAAYQSLLKARRQDLHARIAMALEREFPQVVDAEPEVLAHHCSQAALIEQALGYWARAGELAIRRSANEEAVSHLRRGLACLRALPDGPERDRRELALQNAIGGPLIAIRGYAAPEVGEAYGRARVLCERLGETAPLFAALSGEFVHYFVRGDYGMMQTLAHETRQWAARLPDQAISLAAHRLAAITAMQAGELGQARLEFEQILTLYDPARHRPPPVHYVHDAKISALTYLAVVLWLLGFPEQARRSSEAAFRYAVELNQANLTAHVHVFAGAGLHELLRDVATVRIHAAAIVDLSRRHHLRYWLLNGLILQGWVEAQEGAGEEAVELMRRSATERAALGVGWYQIRYLCLLTEGLLRLDRTDAAHGVLAEAGDLMARNKDRMWEAELARLEGELWHRRREPDRAEASFERALAAARWQEAKGLELRAAIGLARMWSALGRPSKARALLAPILGWFTEGLDTPDPVQARALLDALA